MFDISQVYTGSMVGRNTPANPSHDGTEPVRSEPQTAEEILQHAREEAAELLENAKAEAEEITAQATSKALSQAEDIVATRVNEAFNKLGKDLFSAKHGITEIVGQSLEMMLGAIGNEKAFALCVDQATRSYLSDNKLRVHAHPDSANRLRLYTISHKKNETVKRYEIIDDLSLEAGRCLIDTGDKRIEVSLDVQIQAIKNSIEQSLVHAKIGSAS